MFEIIMLENIKIANYNKKMENIFTSYKIDF